MTAATAPAGNDQQAPEAAGDAAGALDLLLADAALGILRRFRPDSSALRLAVALARRPELVGRRAATLGSELGRIAAGRSQVTPGRRYRRFALLNLIAAAAPSNNPVLSPAGWKALIDTGGLSAVRGIRALARDLSTAP